MSGEQVVVVLALGFAAAGLLLAAAYPFARYRIVWVSTSLAQRALTRRGAFRQARRLRRQVRDEVRVWDFWRGAWVDRDRS